MTKGKIIFMVLLLVLSAYLGYIKYNQVKASEAKEQPKDKGGKKTLMSTGYIVGYGTLQTAISATGTVLAQNAVSLQSEVSGRITSLHIQEGQFVAKGALLVKLNDADLKAQVQKVRAQLRVAETNERRVQELLQINGISQSEYDQAVNTVSSLQADIQVLQVQLSKTEIRAPFAGKLGLRQVSVGAYVTPATVITTLQSMQELKVDISVPEKYIAYVKPGDLIACKSDGQTNVFQARVVAINPQIDESTRNFIVRALIQNAQQVVPGSFVKAEIALKNEMRALLIPTQTIIPDDKSTKVVLCKQGKAKFVQVEIGSRTADRVEILSGLQEGDTILTSGLLQVKPDMAVKIKQIIPNN